MSMLIFICVVVVIITAVLIIRRYTSVEFVSHARLLFRAWSVWLSGIGAALGVYLMSAPDAIITAWNMLPPDLKSMLPVNIAQYVSYLLVVLGIVAQFVRQKRLSEKKEQLDKQP
ncbi:hypothetical protein C3374_14175 [Pantoea sp. PSNIH4]|nr:membrane protein [Pantoea sp. PSNIH2]POU49590.1 hypothetical protein C3380_08405 [Pantoea sp. PSNIH5]POU65601.1 hypothetical protein C3374_14175 [Pantoea sp. PSNIH4]POY65605.1 hypothetical protein C3402_22565 [Pantoea sp. PSNIH3]